MHAATIWSYFCSLLSPFRFFLLTQHNHLPLSWSTWQRCSSLTIYLWGKSQNIKMHRRKINLLRCQMFNRLLWHELQTLWSSLLCVCSGTINVCIVDTHLSLYLYCSLTLALTRSLCSHTTFFFFYLIILLFFQYSLKDQAVQQTGDFFFAFCFL